MIYLIFLFLINLLLILLISFYLFIQIYNLNHFHLAIHYTQINIYFPIKFYQYYFNFYETLTIILYLVFKLIKVIYNY